MDIQFFDFESDHVRSLKSIPMIVRFKLEVCGITMSLRTWNRLGISVRARLVTMPVDSLEAVQVYRHFLSHAIHDVGELVMPEEEDSRPAWGDREKLPEVVARKAEEAKVRVRYPRRWSDLGTLQRFALVKLTRGASEQAQFVPALREFGLAP